MITVTPDDAFALALIAQRPEDNEDLVQLLSDSAKPIGVSLTGKGPVDSDEFRDAVEWLKTWAGTSHAK